MTELLRHEFAPITDEAWEAINETARKVLKTHLSARTFVDFIGPSGWETAAVNLGRIDYEGNKPVDGVFWGQRRVLPLIEVRVPFTLHQIELDDISRGCRDAEFAPLEKAAVAIANFEDRVVYEGFGPAGCRGIRESAVHEPLALPNNVEEYPKVVANAVERLALIGVGGPYTLVLGPDQYHSLLQNTETGYPLHRVVRNTLDGPVVWSDAIVGGLLVSSRGGDFELTVGQDISIGYEAHSKTEVELFLTESFAFRTLVPKAVVPLAQEQ
jgi:uncharacterized linocin/CFP29 family protein